MASKASSEHVEHDEPLPSYEETPEVVVSDGFHTPTALPELPELGAEEEVPPAYSELHDQLSLHQAGFDAGAAVTGEQPTRRNCAVVLTRAVYANCRVN